MANKVLKATLSPKSIENLIKEVQGTVTDIDKVQELFLQFSLEWLKTKALENLQGHRQTGDLESSFSMAITNGIAKLVNNSFHAAYAEYGTGVVGANSPHPRAGEVGYEYDVDSGYKKYKDVYGGNRAWLFNGQPFSGYVGIRYMHNALFDYYYQGGIQICMSMAVEAALK